MQNGPGLHLCNSAKARPLGPILDTKRNNIVTKPNRSLCKRGAPLAPSIHCPLLSTLVLAGTNYRFTWSLPVRQKKKTYGNVPKFIPKNDCPPAFVEWPIEAFFGELKRRVYKNGRYENLRTLKMAIRRELRGSWVFDWLRNTWATTDACLKAVIDAKGQYIGY